jgi:hypothetical protein
MMDWSSIYKNYSIIEKFKSIKGGKFFENESDKNIKVALYIISYYISIVLSIIGLLSSNWFSFSIVLGITIIFNFMFKSVKNDIKRFLLGSSFFISTVLLLFIPINYFHLGIDILEEIKNYIHLN